MTQLDRFVKWLFLEDRASQKSREEIEKGLKRE
jgi:hypothetical protein